jgi:hypothetical protein
MTKKPLVLRTCQIPEAWKQRYVDLYSTHTLECTANVIYKLEREQFANASLPRCCKFPGSYNKYVDTLLFKQPVIKCFKEIIYNLK